VVDVDPAVTSVVVVGSGIAGLTAAAQVRQLHPACEVHLLGREANIGRLPDEWFAEHRISAPLDTRAVALDPAAHQVTLDGGGRLSFTRLILATGAAPRPPSIDGLPPAGVHPLRSADDAPARSAADQHPDLRHVVIVGAGPLGVETARAWSGHGVQLTLIDRHPWPLPGVVDSRAGELVRDELQALGVRVETGVTVERAYGARQVAAVGLSDGRQLPCDLLLLCTGASPNVGLARDAGLAVRRGVVVDATMRTSHPDVFAVGDVAEFGTGATGQWSAAVEQATVAAEQAVTRDPSTARRYHPRPSVVRLDLPGLNVVAIGRSEPDPRDSAVIVFDEPATRRYRKIIVAPDGTVSGGIAVNDPEAVAAIESAATGGTDLRPLLNRTRARELITLSRAQPTRQGRSRRRLAWAGAASAASGAILAAVAVVALLTGGPTDSGGAAAPAGRATAGSPGQGPQASARTLDSPIADILQHPRITWSDEARQTMLSGGADGRLLALLVALAAEHDITISALPEVPGVPTGSTYRAVAISAVDGAALTGSRALDLATWFNAQQAPYRPAAVLVTSGDNPALYVALDGSVPTSPATP
jgi:NADPH-dependent 2,4-dienoyl-CoA reductase/sulfur reductase-like enzyme